jgi:nicotinamide phosphoribosyltransferase
MTDAYKTGHIFQYPPKTTAVYSNLTARTSRMPGIEAVVVFGIQYFLREYLLRQFNDGFFHLPKSIAVNAYRRRLDNALGRGAVSMEHIEALHDLGYLPVRIKALPEGTRCPIKVPFLTIVNTLPEFFWVTNFLETLLCNVVWHPITSATIAAQYRKILDDYARATSDQEGFTQWQGHDFSMRGHTSLESSCVSGAAHLLSFKGTDTIPAIDWLERYYYANSDAELIGGSVPATEHSVMCLGGKETELETFHRLITQVYPSGPVSIVSDTWDYWKVLNETVRGLKAEIMAREGCVIIRPDSGDPVKILLGDHDAPPDSLAHRGTIDILWEIFGGTVNSKGFRQLDPHISVIYGDSITLDRCKAICSGLLGRMFASTNVVFGIGSYTYQHVTRDTFGFAMKATAGVVNGQRVTIFKDPATDDGVKRSAKGLLRVNADLTLSENVSEAEEQEGLLRVVFEDGVLMNALTLTNVRDILRAGGR